MPTHASGRPEPSNRILGPLINPIKPLYLRGFATLGVERDRGDNFISIYRREKDGPIGVNFVLNLEWLNATTSDRWEGGHKNRRG
jgi:hypothetical protein